MWVITGPFDDDHSDGQAPDKRKLLKTGREYTVGRKDQPILIKNKAISKAHAVLVVGPCDDHQAADPSFIPTLTFHNITERVRPVERPSLQRPRVPCQPKSNMQLEHGDIIHLSATIFIRIHWEKLCCYYAPSRGNSSQLSAKDCAASGIHIVPTLHPDVTHHLTSTYALTPSLATSLISVATLVKPDWLAAVLNAAKADPGELSALEHHFLLPPTNKYRPSFSPSLPPRLKKFDAWEPNEARAGLFTNHRFIFVGEKAAEAQTAHKEIVKRGGGDYECFAADNGPDKLIQLLSKGRARGATLALVAVFDTVLAALGDAGWNQLLEAAKSFQLKFVHPDKLVEAAVYANISYVDCTLDAEDVPQESVLPDVIPNTIENEPSIVPASGSFPLVPPAHDQVSMTEAERAVEPAQAVPRRRLARRAASRASSRGPSPPPAPDVKSVEEAPQLQAEPPRRTLVRRAARAQAVLDPDESSMTIDPGGSTTGADGVRASTPPDPPRRAPSVVPPTPTRASRLKRRVGTQAQQSTAISQMLGTDDDVLIPDVKEERPYKRHKSLFEEADPDRIAMRSVDDYGTQRVDAGESLTQFEPSVPFQLRGETQSGTRSARAGRSDVGPTQLGPLMEEEEESTLDSRAGTQDRGTKRKVQERSEDVEMGDEGESRPKVKRRTDDRAAPAQEIQQTQAAAKPMSKVITRVDMAQTQVHEKPKPASKKGQKVETEPDKDHAFLKAVASTKRGKKSEDTFDREFNNLKISKPDLERQREDEEWKVLEEFGDDGDVRGNFMVVVEFPVFRTDTGGSRDHLRRGEGRLEWQGRQDFKKFKRKDLGERRQPIELVVEEENDLGIGSQYWKGSYDGNAPSQSRTQPATESRSSHTQRSMAGGTKEQRPSLDSDSDDARPVAKPVKKGAKLPAKASATRGKARAQERPLFIDSDEEDDVNDDSIHVESDDVESEVQGTEPTLASSSRPLRGDKGKGTGNKKAPAVVVDDDSDDGVKFKAFGSRTRARRK